ncbi:MerR family transcriptional regulator [Alteribacter natronophilus]|uniref:MerR family transcriptional regulator n=1 Tax=Alteribacter natronophilus TaxID=2583810 RepID=UPI00110F6221|nr:MerR family transcriptional regulator [Alteribacter natronophilus]TMW73626.1 MerR family transcriptional regulator [Alteribacter natronophilus]
MNRKEGKYNIKAVSKLLGIQAGTLRAWERRYEIIEPVRNQAGHRLYTDEHVAILKWLLNKVEKGFTIGQAVGLLEDEEITEIGTESEQHDDRVSGMRNDLLDALLHFREQKSNQILDQAFAMFTVEKVMNGILVDLLYEVGQLWEKGEITTAHEHYISAFLRTKIGSIFHTLPTDGLLPRVICVCGPDETHEIGLLIFTLYLRRRGYEVIYLGAGIPEKDLATVVEQVAPSMLFMSCTIDAHLHQTLRLGESLRRDFPTLRVGVGGAAVQTLGPEDQSEYGEMLVGSCNDEWDIWIRGT